MGRVDELQRRIPDARGRRVVFLGHCLLNQNVRYLGGATRAGGVDEVVDGYLRRGIGICQLPCPEQRAWGGVLKRRMLLSFGSAGTPRAPLARWLLRPFVRYTRWRYALLARRIARDVRDYQRSGMEVVGVVGVAGSPSCGVRTTLDLPASVDVLTRCPLRALDGGFVNEAVIRGNATGGAGMFTTSLRAALTRVHAQVPFDEYDVDEYAVDDTLRAAASAGQASSD